MSSKLTRIEAIEADRGVAGRVSTALKANPPEDAPAERRVLEAALKAPDSVPEPDEAPIKEEIAAGLRLEARTGRVVLSGKAVDGDFIEALQAWLSETR